MKIKNVITGILLFAVTFVASIYVTTFKTEAAVSKPSVSISVTKDTINKKKYTETTTFKIKNKSDKDITILAYGEIANYDPYGDGGLYLWNTKDKKDVTIPAGESKKVTYYIPDAFGVVGKQAQKHGGAAFYINYDGKYFKGEWRGTKKKNTTMKVREKIHEIDESDYLELLDY